jgi:hypothetical protein
MFHFDVVTLMTGCCCRKTDPSPFVEDVPLVATMELLNLVAWTKPLFSTELFVGAPYWLLGQGCNPFVLSVFSFAAAADSCFFFV